MAQKAIETLKQWFSKGKYPTALQFWDWLDSFWHKSEKIPMESIEGLTDAMNSKADAERLKGILGETALVEFEQLDTYFDAASMRNGLRVGWTAVGSGRTNEGHILSSSDSMRHGVNQLFFTNMLPNANGELDRSHFDNKMNILYRYYNISAPNVVDPAKGSWSKWKIMWGDDNAATVADLVTRVTALEGTSSKVQG